MEAVSRQQILSAINSLLDDPCVSALSSVDIYLHFCLSENGVTLQRSPLAPVLNEAQLHKCSARSRSKAPALSHGKRSYPCSKNA